MGVRRRSVSGFFHFKEGHMYKNTKLCSVISYITWVGFIIAFLIRDQEDEMVKHHLNQALSEPYLHFQQLFL